MKRKRILLISLLLVYAIVVPVFAYEYFFRTSTSSLAAGIILHQYATPTMKLGFYWDKGCTQPVTSFDFGNMTHPNQAINPYIEFFIRNEGSTWHQIFWNSTLSSVSNEITDTLLCDYGGYWHPLNGTTINPGDVAGLHYFIAIPAYATVGTFNWTLNIWGVNTY